MADTNLTYPYELEGGQRAVASEVMADFEAVKLFANGINATINEFKAAIADLQKKPTREMLDIYYSLTSEAPVGAYPLWTGETITNCKTLYPQFWKKLNQLAANSQVPTVADNAAYEEKLEKYGQCAAFFIDTLNGHIRLPKVTRFISSIENLSDIGEYNDKLKEHAHNIFVSEDGSKGGYSTKDGYLARGFTKYSSPWSSYTSAENEKLVKSAGEGGETMPKHVRLYLYLQVANNVAEISELDVNAIIEQMNIALDAMKTAYDGYAADLEKQYQRIKEDIINSSPVIKEEDLSTEGKVWGILLPGNEYYAAGYRYEIYFAIEGATEDMVPIVTFNIADALSGNFAPVAEAQNGYVRLFAKESVLTVIKTIALI